jgi:DNA-binding transcriptional LysR family regulator
MNATELSELLAFVQVVRDGSFTRAAVQLGASPSAISQAVRSLEEKVGVKLLKRSTRQILTTAEGERLYDSMGSRFAEIDVELAAAREFRERPAGVVRITTAEFAANWILWPKLQPLLSQFPDISIEISIDYTLSDIIEKRFDAGVRLGNQVARDMVSVRISLDMRVAVVATPEYFLTHRKPTHPRDLLDHNCINLRLPTHGKLLAWDFKKGDEELILPVQGQWVFGSVSPIHRCALSGAGIAFLPDLMVEEDIRSGNLVQVLEDWCEPFTGYHLYYPSRRQSGALKVVIDALRIPM